MTDKRVGSTERAQLEEQQKHVAAQCEQHKVQFAVCGCEPPAEKKTKAAK